MTPRIDTETSCRWLMAGTLPTHAIKTPGMGFDDSIARRLLVVRSVGQSVSRSVGQSVSQSVSSGNRRSLASHRSASRPGGAAMDTVQAKVCRNHTASVESRMKTAFIAGRQNWHRYRRGGPPHRIQCRLIANRPNVPSAPDRSEILLRGTSWRSFFLRVENKEGRTRSLIAPNPGYAQTTPSKRYLLRTSAPRYRRPAMDAGP